MLRANPLTVHIAEPGRMRDVIDVGDREDWQLFFHLGWLGAPGRGRALGLGGLKFNGQITPESQLITYNVDIKRVLRRGFAISIANGKLDVDGQIVYEAQDLRVGVFTSTDQM